MHTYDGIRLYNPDAFVEPSIATFLFSFAFLRAGGQPGPLSYDYYYSNKNNNHNNDNDNNNDNNNDHNNDNNNDNNTVLGSSRCRRMCPQLSDRVRLEHSRGAPQGSDSEFRTA